MNLDTTINWRTPDKAPQRTMIIPGLWEIPWFSTMLARCKSNVHPLSVYDHLPFIDFFLLLPIYGVMMI